MNKKFLSVLLTLVLFAFLCVTSFAVTENATENDIVKRRLIDNAQLLAYSEETELVTELDKFSEREQIDITIFTTEGLGGLSVEDYAERIFDIYEYGYGEDLDGIMLVVSMESCDYDIYAHGQAENIFTADIREYIASQFVPYLSDGEYKEAFLKYINLCELTISDPQYIEIEADDYHADYETVTELTARPDSMPIRTGFVAIAIGVGIALFIVFKMISKLKTVRHQRNADSYVIPGSLNINESRDIFLYHTVTKTAKPKNTNNNSTHSGGFSSSSGSGGSHTSGKF